MGCGCGGQTAGKASVVNGFAVVYDVALANTPNLIPASDKYATSGEAAVAAKPGQFIVAIVSHG